VKATPLYDLQLLVVTEVQEVCVIEYEPQLALYQAFRDEQEGDSPILNDPEPIAAPFESHAKFQEDEGEDLNTQSVHWFLPLVKRKNFKRMKSFKRRNHRLTK
jgi:hypothetical protein